MIIICYLHIRRLRKQIISRFQGISEVIQGESDKTDETGVPDETSTFHRINY